MAVVDGRRPAAPTLVKLGVIIVTVPCLSLEFVNPPFPRKNLLHLVVGDHVVLLDGLLDDVNAIENSSDEAKIGCDFQDVRRQARGAPFARAIA